MDETLKIIELGQRFLVNEDRYGDKAWVELLDFMPHPSTDVSGDMAIVNAARTSYLGESKGADKDKKLLFYLYRNRHTSPFEMVQFKFRIRVPLVTFWQLVRHRTLSLNLQSGRYTPFEENDFYVPTKTDWRKQSENNKQGSSGDTLALDEQIDIISDLIDIGINDISPETSNLSQLFELWARNSYTIYERLLLSGAAKEQARLFLPAFSLYYQGVVSVDAHNLMHFLRLRMDEHAQQEIRDLADVIYEKIFKVCLPWTSEAFEKYQYVIVDTEKS